MTLEQALEYISNNHNKTFYGPHDRDLDRLIDFKFDLEFILNTLGIAHVPDDFAAKALTHLFDEDEE